MNFDAVKNELRKSPKKWLVTGCAGFIGSNIIEELINLDQIVVGLDNFITGHQRNLDEVINSVGEKSSSFTFIEGDIRDLEVCRRACEGVDYVVHQAALGSVPRSIERPADTNDHNVNGFLNVLIAAKDAKVKGFVYASSSSVYGDHPDLPKVEGKVGSLLSPYAASKRMNEVYADVFYRTYQFRTCGLRYFNVFGKRQDPNGPYAAVIPKWINKMIKNENVEIFGDGATSRDFCFVDNAVQANILGAFKSNTLNAEVFNVALGDRTSLNELFEMLTNSLKSEGVDYNKKPQYKDFRLGDVRHSQADYTRAQQLINYNPLIRVSDGIDIAINWYVNNL